VLIIREINFDFGMKKNEEAEFRGEYPVTIALKTLGGKWKIRIINSLMDGKQRYRELRKLIPEVSEKMLSQELKELEKSKIVERKSYPTVPPMVEYSLTEYGESLKTLITSLSEWGANHLQQTREER
jgi:DNA-binding HxlR family transcriptional regulator